MYHFATQLGGRYLSSNVNITIPSENGSAFSVPVGGVYFYINHWRLAVIDHQLDRFRKFETEKYMSNVIM